MAFVTSTMSAPISYVFYKTLPGGMQAVAEEITIKGGANVADKKTILTPRGVSTELTDAQIEALKKHPIFREHLKNGFVTIVETKYKEKAEKAVKSLEKKDGSAPKTPADYKKKPKVKK